jgi:hypothetical protein
MQRLSDDYPQPLIESGRLIREDEAGEKGKAVSRQEDADKASCALSVVIPCLDDAETVADLDAKVRRAP